MSIIHAFIAPLSIGLLLLGTAGCESKKTAAEVKAEQEKAWRAKARVEAAKYYQQLIQQYPDSPYTDEARQRLQALGPIAGTPAPRAAARK